MTITRYLVAGNRGTVEEFEFVGVQDLLGVDSIVGWVRRHTGRVGDPREVAVEIVDAAARVCAVNYGVADDDWLPSLADITTIETWQFEVEASWPDAAPQTSPRRSAVMLRVRPRSSRPDPVDVTP